jgi:hypothetical protein
MGRSRDKVERITGIHYSSRESSSNGAAAAWPRHFDPSPFCAVLVLRKRARLSSGGNTARPDQC